MHYPQPLLKSAAGGSPPEPLFASGVGRDRAEPFVQRGAAIDLCTDLESIADQVRGAWVTFGKINSFYARMCGLETRDWPPVEFSCFLAQLSRMTRSTPRLEAALADPELWALRARAIAGDNPARHPLYAPRQKLPAGASAEGSPLARDAEPAFIWAGSSLGSIHIDEQHSLLCQVHGRKLFKVALDTDACRLYIGGDGEMPRHSRVGYRHWSSGVSEESFPLAASARFSTGILSAGDLLFIPRGWPHAVVSDLDSVSLSFKVEQSPWRPSRIGGDRSTGGVVCPST